MGPAVTFRLLFCLCGFMNFYDCSGILEFNIKVTFYIFSNFRTLLILCNFHVKIWNCSSNMYTYIKLAIHVSLLDYLVSLVSNKKGMYY